jgi:hypothetical protein
MTGSLTISALSLVLPTARYLLRHKVTQIGKITIYHEFDWENNA